MNNLIEKFAKQVGNKLFPINGGVVYWGNEDIKDFALLVINECLDVIDQLSKDSTKHEIRSSVYAAFDMPRYESKMQKYLKRLCGRGMIAESDIASTNVYIVHKDATIISDTSAFALGRCFKVIAMTYDEKSDTLTFTGTRHDEVYKAYTIESLMENISHSWKINIEDIL